MPVSCPPLEMVAGGGASTGPVGGAEGNCIRQHAPIRPSF